MDAPEILHEDTDCDCHYRIVKLGHQQFEVQCRCQLCHIWTGVIETSYPGYRNRVVGFWVAAFDLRRLKRWCSEACKQKAKRRLARRQHQVTEAAS